MGIVIDFQTGAILLRESAASLSKNENIDKLNDIRKDIARLQVVRDEIADLRKGLEELLEEEKK